MKKILSAIRKADQQFNMINPNDKIAVGLSGGKDSLLLLYSLSLYKHFSKNPFELSAIMLGLDQSPVPDKVKDFCDKINVELIYQPTDIKEIVFDIRKEKNPCSLCAKLRRGILHSEAKKIGYDKVALGHHREDVLETMLLSLFFESRMHVFSPLQYLDRSDITLIRPMVYVPENDIINNVKKLDLPVVTNPCPANGYTKRQDMKELLKSFNNIIGGADAAERMINALSKTDEYKLWDKITRKD